MEHEMTEGHEEKKRIIVAVTPRKQVTWVVEKFSLTLPELLAELAEIRERVDKDGLALVPAIFRPPFQDAKFEGAGDSLTDKPYRKAINVGAVTIFVVDIDGWTAERWDTYLGDLKARGAHFFAHPTHSFGVKPLERWRVYFFLSKPIEIGSTERWSRSIWPALMRHVGLDPDKAADADGSCCDAARLYYLPSKPPGATQPAQIYNPGKDIEVDDIVEGLPVAPKSQRQRALVSPRVEGTEPAVESELWERLKRFKKPKQRELIQKMKKGEPIAEPDHRHRALNDATWLLACVARDEESSESVLEVLRPSLQAMREADGTSRDWEGEALRSLEGARVKKARADAKKHVEEEEFRRIFLENRRQVIAAMAAKPGGNA
jgi:hypothetical protein